MLIAIFNYLHFVNLVKNSFVITAIAEYGLFFLERFFKSGGV